MFGKETSRKQVGSDDLYPPQKKSVFGNDNMEDKKTNDDSPHEKAKPIVNDLAEQDEVSDPELDELLDG